MLSSNKVTVNVCSDAASVELFLNGNSLARKYYSQYTTNAGFTYQLCDGHTFMTWSVPYASGMLSAVTYDAQGNIITDTQGTSSVSTTRGSYSIDASASAFSTLGDIVTVYGTASVLGAEMPVTASVRVVENTVSENVALSAVADADQYNTEATTHDLPKFANDGINNLKGYTSWTRSLTYDNSYLSLGWDTPYTIDHLILYLRNDETSFGSVLPDSIEVYSSMNASEPIVTVSSGYQAGTCFVINLGGVQTDCIKVLFRYTSEKYIMVDELEAYTVSSEIFDTAVPDSFTANDTEIPVMKDSLSYSAELENLETISVSVNSSKNLAYTILPLSQEGQYIVTEPEDQSSTLIYHLSYTQKETPVEPEVGVLVTASLRCNVSELMVGERADLELYDVFLSDGTDATKTNNAELKLVSGTAELEGFTLIASQPGTVVVKATVTLNGVSIDTNNVAIVVSSPALKEPDPVVSVGKSGNKFVVTGSIDALVSGNESDYCEIVEYGLLYISNSKLGTKSLTVNTSGRTKVKFTRCNSDGSFSYSFKPTTSSMKYAFACYVRYYDEEGKLIYRYSPIYRTSLSAIQ